METNNPTKSFTSIGFFSPAAFIIAFIGFFLTFTDINCNGQKIDSVTGFEFVKGYSSDNDFGDVDETSSEKYNPNIFLLIAFVIAAAGAGFYFIKQLRLNYKIMTLIAIIGFISMILFMIDLKDKIASVDPEKNLNTETYVSLEAEMKFGFWLVTLCFLLAAVWNWLKGKEKALGSGQVEIMNDSSPVDPHVL